MHKFFKKFNTPEDSIMGVRKVLKCTYIWIDTHIFNTKLFRVLNNGCFYLYNAFIYLLVPFYYVYRLENPEDLSLLSAKQIE